MYATVTERLMEISNTNMRTDGNNYYFTIFDDSHVIVSVVYDDGELCEDAFIYEMPYRFNNVNDFLNELLENYELGGEGIDIANDSYDYEAVPGYYALGYVNG